MNILTKNPRNFLIALAAVFGLYAGSGVYAQDRLRNQGRTINRSMRKKAGNIHSREKRRGKPSLKCRC